MVHLLFVILYLSRSVKGTSATCPPPESDGSSRTLWSILWSCALTLLICVWHAIHPDVPPPRQKWWEAWLRLSTVFQAIAPFFLPQWVVYIACKQWYEARWRIIEFQDARYQWSMIHSFFAEMGGFYYCDETGSLCRIDSIEFLRLLEAREIANPVITELEIKDKSKLDSLGIFFLSVQLIWFTLQVVIRIQNRLVVTLVELDTVCMATVTLCLLFFWWNKPVRPKRPHIFYSHLYLRTDSDLLRTREWEFPDDLLPARVTAVAASGMARSNISIISLFTSWLIFGGLHLTAWNFPFVTEGERMTWRIASLIFAGSALACIVLAFTFGCYGSDSQLEDPHPSLLLGLGLALLSRMVLVALIFASLRSLPSSAYQTVPWTAYIPHL
ncbi:hypothetical protein OG21DRAFT_1512916 [Imleria badia]|nr:hypothetical protein OG21DRAFT_1512916 [Imleria badia]